MAERHDHAGLAAAGVEFEVGCAEALFVGVDEVVRAWCRGGEVVAVGDVHEEAGVVGFWGDAREGGDGEVEGAADPVGGGAVDVHGGVEGGGVFAEDVDLGVGEAFEGGEDFLAFGRRGLVDEGVVGRGGRVLSGKGRGEEGEG